MSYPWELSLEYPFPGKNVSSLQAPLGSGVKGLGFKGLGLKS